MDVDEMLHHAGDFGRYQLILIFLFSVINVLSTFDYFGQTFLFVMSPHWCRLPEIEQVTTARERRFIWAPPGDPACSRFDMNLSDISTPPDANWSTRPCDVGWEYNLTMGYNSVINELNWVCDDDWKPALGQSLFFVGCVFGTLALGIMADHVGRLPVLVLANMLSLFGNLATYFTSDLLLFGASRFMHGLSTDTNFVMICPRVNSVPVLEYMRPDKRTLGLNMSNGVFSTVATVALPWIATGSGDWRSFLLIISLPLVVVPLYYLVVPESASWLISKGRTDEAVTCFEKVAAFNGRKLPPDIVKEFKESSKMAPSEKSRNLLGLFRTPRLRRKTCILIFKSMVLTLCFDAISRNVEGLGYSPFVIFSVTGVTKLPSSLVIVGLQDRLGRKAMASGALFLSGVFTVASGVTLAILGSGIGDLIFYFNLSYSHTRKSSWQCQGRNKGFILLYYYFYINRSSQ
uniref:(California timema) hypothetical protein n=1 Tax=Timema californicum TaxID=61474 RepID=A0A7R9JCR7_TIMCA|nr:unnamed protein product [Timema californicum]